MTRPDMTSKPKLARGCRLSDAAANSATLLMPEGALQLNGPGLRIVTRCDGQHTFQQIVDELQSEFQAQSTQIEQETAAFLEKLREKRVVDY